MAAPYNRPDLDFADASVGDIIVDMRQRVDWGTFEITDKVDDEDDYQKNYIEATSIVTGSVIRIPQIDFWAKIVHEA
ncbi:MAG: hypothetical protein ACOC56_04020 [Atribacterota bacterium]